MSGTSVSVHRSAVWRYGVAVASVALALAVRMAVDPYLDSPFVTFFVAVAATAWFGGLEPALLSTVLGYLAADWFFMLPPHTLAIHSASDAVGAASFLMVTLAIAFFSEAMHRARAHAALEKKRLEAVMEALPVGVLLVDARGGVILWNATFDQVWGGPRPPTRAVSDYGAYRGWWANTGLAVQPENGPRLAPCKRAKRWSASSSKLNGSTAPVPLS